MVMLMIKFGAYKAACCWVCAPSFSRRQQNFYDATMRVDLGERENKAKNQVSEPLLALLQFFPSLSPSPRRLFLLLIRKGRKRERERDAGTTENAPVTDDSEQSSDDE